MMEIGLYSTQASWKLLLDLSNNGTIESNYRYIKLISRNKEPIKCPTAIRTPGKPCISLDKYLQKRLQANAC